MSWQSSKSSLPWSLSMYIYAVAGGLLLVVGGVVNDETDRYWGEALLLLHVAVANSN